MSLRIFYTITLFVYHFILPISLYAQDSASVEILIKTFRGNEKRNFYGKNAPSRLKILWKSELGSGWSMVHGAPKKWSGAGWTGQALLIKENGKLALIQGAYDYLLRKIDARTGKTQQSYNFDDIVKGTGTIWENPQSEKPENRYIILQGSRYGYKNDWKAKVIPSFRAISLNNFKELWRMNVKKTYSYSRDVDASPLVLNDTAYIGLENGLFTVFNPDPKYAALKDSITQPSIFKEHRLYNDSDIMLHGLNFVTEASPALMKDKIIIAGCSRIYAYNLKTRRLDWNFYVGTDIDGTPVVTNDDKVLVALEKQYIKGKGGVLKLDPYKPESEAVEWFFPTNDKKFGEWDGGIIGSVAVNDYYKTDSIPGIACFTAIDGYLYVVDYNTIDTSKTVVSFDGKTILKTPKLLFKYDVGSGISSPIMTEDKIIATSSTGIFLFGYSFKQGKFTFNLLGKITGIPIESAPIVWEKRIYVASRNGFMYCFGE